MSGAPNVLYYGDNLKILRERIPTESVDLVYLDPPFNSNRNYNVLFADKHHPGQERAQMQAFDDTWTWTQESDRLYFELVASGGATPEVADALQAFHNLLGENDMLAYLVMMAARLSALRDALRPTGTLYLHCDLVAVHYLKVLLDAVFGPQFFLNHITWQRTFSHGNVGRNFGSISDFLLVYTKGRDYVWNQQYAPMTPDYIEKTFKYSDPDGRKWQSVTMRNPADRPNLKYDYTASNGITYKPHRNGWGFDEKRMRQLDKEGRIHFPAKPTGALRLKMYLDESPGIRLQNIWTDIPPVGAQAAERLGFPTQKPLALLDRIIRTSSNEGDVVLDPFCGCGTALVAAQAANRRWVGIDVAYIAVDLMAKRLLDSFGSQAVFKIQGSPRDVEGAAALFAESHFEFERWAVSLVWGQPKERPGGDQGVDGVIRFPMVSKNEVGRVIVSVKGGASVNPAFVRDLVGTIEREKAEMGVLITLANPTRGMTKEAQHSGSYTWPVSGEAYPRIQCLTVEQLLTGERVKMPPPLMPYIQATRHVPESDQAKLVL